MVGPKIGFQLASVDFRDRNYLQNYDVVPVPGFNAGAMANFRVNNYFSLQTEFMYSLEGKGIIGYSEELTSHYARYHFLRMPILFRYTFDRPYSPVKAYVNVGPNISRWFGGRGTIEATDLFEFYDDGKFRYQIQFDPNSLSETRANLVLNEPVKWQLGMDFGFGFIYQMSKKHRFVLDFRYLYGHSFLARDIEVDVSLAPYFENFQSSPRVFAISVGYLYDIDLFAWAKGKSTSKEK